MKQGKGSEIKRPSNITRVKQGVSGGKIYY